MHSTYGHSQGKTEAMIAALVARLADIDGKNEVVTVIVPNYRAGDAILSRLRELNCPTSQVRIVVQDRAAEAMRGRRGWVFTPSAIYEDAMVYREALDAGIVQAIAAFNVGAAPEPPPRELEREWRAEYSCVPEPLTDAPADPDPGSGGDFGGGGASGEW